MSKFVTVEFASEALGMITMLFENVRMRVARQPMSSTQPLGPPDTSMKSPLRIEESEIRNELAKMFDSSGDTARATARPPRPRPVSSGLMAIPTVSSMTSTAIRISRTLTTRVTIGSVRTSRISAAPSLPASQPMKPSTIERTAMKKSATVELT